MSMKIQARRLKNRVRDHFDLIPIQKAVFLWDHSTKVGDRYPDEALVVVPRDLDGVDASAFTSSTGGDTEGWPSAAYNNPGFVFGQLVFGDWSSKSEQIEALAEFAKIDEIDWAREVLRGIAFNVGAFEHDEAISYWSEISSIEDVERFRDAILSALSERDQ